MSNLEQKKVAIVNMGLGNLFSIKHACEKVGLDPFITSKGNEILAASAVILPGMGAFGDAMQQLKNFQLIEIIQEVVASDKPLLGICLGMQLLLKESHEFGVHQGLGIVSGQVVRFDNPKSEEGGLLKVPQIGWNRIFSDRRQHGSGNVNWKSPYLNGIQNDEFMYFVHSYHVVLEDESIATSFSRYGDVEFCSSFQYGSIFACQFHPERSGSEGIRVYQNLAAHLTEEC